MSYGAVTVGTTAVKVVDGSTSRQTVALIQNNSDSDMFLGKNSSVTTSNGLKLSPGATVSVPLATEEQVWAICGSAGKDARYLRVGNPTY